MAISDDILQRSFIKIGWLFTGYATNPSMIFMIIGVVGVLSYLYKPYWKVRKVPGPPVVPLLGHLLLMAKYGPDVFSILSKKYGPIFRFHLGRQPLIIVADPELCKEVGMKKCKDIPYRSIPSPISASPLHQKGLFFTRNDRWLRMRNTVVSMYQPTQLASLVPTMQSFIESATQNIEISSTRTSDVVFSDISLRMATDVIGQAAFGVDFGLSKPQSDDNHNQNMDKNGNNNHEVSDFIKQHIYSTTKLKMDLSGSVSIILGLLIPILQEPVRQILKRIPGTMDWKIETTNKKLSGRLDEIISKRIIEEKKLGADHESKDLLSLILKARPNSELFTQDYISAIVYEHLLAGSATTAFTLSSVVYLVSIHAKVEKKLLAEIDGFGPHDQMPTVDDLQHKFPYLDQVIKEAMRFYFVSPLIARETAKQVEIGGYLVPKGTWVWLAPGVLAKDASHFPNPDEFKPERFDPECEEEKRRHPFAFIPFGIGARVCIGQKFSLQEIKMSLIHLYRKFVFRHSPNMESPLELEYGIVLNFKHGIKLRVINRK